MIPRTMSAVVQRRYGPPACLSSAELPVPEPGAGEVLVRVSAAAIDQGTLHMLDGRPYIARPDMGLRRPRRVVPGLDVAGVVEAVGAHVTGFATGDEVFGIAQGSLAEFALARADKLAIAPAGIDTAQCAALGVSGLTALQAVRKGEVQPGQRVLIIGASGGVGHFAVQIAVARGAEVTAVCRSAKADMVRSLGATQVLAHDRGELAAVPADLRWDVVIDIAGNASVRRLRRLATPKGTVVIVGGDTGGRWTAGYGRNLRAMAVSPFVGTRLLPLVSKEIATDLIALRDLVDEGRLRAHVDRTFPLRAAPEALTYLASGAAFGKVVVTVAERTP